MFLQRYMLAMWRNISPLILFVCVNFREGISICKWPCGWQEKIFLDTWFTPDNQEINRIWKFSESEATVDGSMRVCWEINGPFITLLDEDNRRQCWRVDIITPNVFIFKGKPGDINVTDFCANCDIPSGNPVHTVRAPVNAEIGCVIPEQCDSSDPNDVKCTWKEKPLKECRKC